MTSPEENNSIKICSACGASIYQEHFDRGLAGMWAGQLLCTACLREKREPPTEPDHSSVAAESTEVGGFALGAEVLPSAGLRPGTFPEVAGTGARHIRTFHSKLSDAAVQHLDEQVNSWLAGHPAIEIKFASATIGTWEGKHPEPNLILTLFY